MSEASQYRAAIIPKSGAWWVVMLEERRWGDTGWRMVIGASEATLTYKGAHHVAAKLLRQAHQGRFDRKVEYLML